MDNRPIHCALTPESKSCWSEYRCRYWIRQTGPPESVTLFCFACGHCDQTSQCITGWSTSRNPSKYSLSYWCRCCTTANVLASQSTSPLIYLISWNSHSPPVDSTDLGLTIRMTVHSKQLSIGWDTKDSPWRRRRPNHPQYQPFPTRSCSRSWACQCVCPRSPSSFDRICPFIGWIDGHQWLPYGTLTGSSCCTTISMIATGPDWACSTITSSFDGPCFYFSDP